MKSANFQMIEADVVVLGGGLAGCWAALAAKERTCRVILVDKAMVARSGCSTFAAGVMLAPLSDDNLEEWAREIVENGEFMNDQKWVVTLLNEQMGRLADMQGWGFPFEMGADERLVRIIGRAHKKTRVLMFHGHKLMEGMRKKVLEKGVELKERIMVTDLLLNQGGTASPNRLVGVIGRHTRSDEWVVLNAGALVLACGPIFFKDGGGYVDNISGDGVAMAYRAGATLTDMEFATQCNIIIWRRKYKASGINMFQGYGAHIVNANGERFMERYDPVLKERSKTSILGAAFTKEALEGRGPIYMDMRHLKPEVFKKFERVIPKTMQVFRAAGIDPRHDLMECTPSVHTPHSSSGEGGIRVDIDCRTDLPGLFAAGGSTKHKPHGTYAVGGLNLAYCCVSGYRAGYGASRFAQGNLRPPMPGNRLLADYIDRQERSFAGGQVDLEEIIREIKLVTVPAKYSFFKHRRRINETLARLEEIEAGLLPEAKVDGVHNWVKGMEIRNYLTCARLVYKAALLREESRGSLFREEFPNRDDRHWLKWITIKRIGHEDRIIIEPIPLDSYPFKPKSLAPVPFPVQYYFKK